MFVERLLLLEQVVHVVVRDVRQHGPPQVVPGELALAPYFSRDLAPSKLDSLYPSFFVSSCFVE